jgi:hypothetical protein
MLDISNLNKPGSFFQFRRLFICTNQIPMSSLARLRGEGPDALVKASGILKTRPQREHSTLSRCPEDATYSDAFPRHPVSDKIHFHLD